MNRYLSDPSAPANGIHRQFRDAVLRAGGVYYFDVVRSGGRCMYVRKVGRQLVQCEYYMQNMERSGAYHIRICPNDCPKHTATFPGVKPRNVEEGDDAMNDPWNLAQLIDLHNKKTYHLTLMKLIPLLGCYELRCAIHQKLSNFPSMYT